MSDTLSPRFNDLVAEAITANSDLKPEQIIVLDNSDKYAPDGIPLQPSSKNSESLSQIFETMANVNRMALESDSLCAGRAGPSFRDALVKSAKRVAQLVKGRPVRYVELGPEPWKSRAVLAHLLSAGIQLACYVGIDINPESEATMREALAPVIGIERFAYLIADFYKCSADDIPEPRCAAAGGRCVTILTNMGFQEGNDLPGRIGPMLTNLTRPGDLILSEMQVMPTEGTETQTVIEDFYHHPEMRRFSGLVGRSFDPECSLDDGSGPEKGSEYRFHLVPVQTEIGVVQAATTLISVVIHGAKRYVLTNSCLKYTLGQFNLARETMGRFSVREVLETGDGSVVFQIAERLEV